MEKLSISETPIKATCHCGAITVTAPRKPDAINDCQCTICRRYGAAWSYYSTKDVDITIKEGSLTRKYVWGDRQVAFNFCETCGCMCYWYPYASDRPQRPDGGFSMGVNTRMMDPAELRDVNRMYTADVIFEPLKAKETAHPEDRAKY